MKRILFILFITASCSGDNLKDVDDASLSPLEFQEALSAEVVLIDVRTPGEYASGFIPGAVNIDFKSDDFGQRLDSLDKSRTYMLYCAGGGRSDRAAELMKEKEFKNVRSLEGGLSAWTESGLAVTKDE
jgi:phage shock protein E